MCSSARPSAREATSYALPCPKAKSEVTLSFVACPPRRRCRPTRALLSPRRTRTLRSRRRTNDAVLRADEIRQMDRENLLAALDRTGGKFYGPDGAAAVLGLEPTTLASRLRKLNLSSTARPARRATFSIARPPDRGAPTCRLVLRHREPDAAPGGGELAARGRY